MSPQSQDLFVPIVNLFSNCSGFISLRDGAFPIMNISCGFLSNFRLNILIGASTDQFVQYYQVEAKKSTENNN